MARAGTNGLYLSGDTTQLQLGLLGADRENGNPKNSAPSEQWDVVVLNNGAPPQARNLTYVSWTSAILTLRRLELRRSSPSPEAGCREQCAEPELSMLDKTRLSLPAVSLMLQLLCGNGSEQLLIPSERPHLPEPAEPKGCCG